MDKLKKRIVIILFLALLIVGGSFYGYWRQKTIEADIVVAESQISAAKVAQEEEINVYITGGVHNPGAYKLKPGSRVSDVIAAAGGLKNVSDAERINLVQTVKDGMHVYISKGGGSSVKGDSETTLALDEKISINTNIKSELERLPGIGAITAEKIIDYRAANGSFTDINQLRRVQGIGENKFNKIKDKIVL